MACPDEDTFARFVEGLLPPGEASAIERHVDGCPRCADLAAAFGRLYAPSSTAAPRIEDVGLVQLALGLSAALHVAWSVVIGHAPAALAALAPAELAAAYRGYATFWGPAGAGWAILIMLALRLRWRGGRGERSRTPRSHSRRSS
jgi:anti-sigma factor RsiW